MTTNEVQDTLLSEEELKIKIISDALHIHYLWFKDKKLMPRYFANLEELKKKYDEKYSTVLAKHNLSGSIYDAE
tara:strand:+ start:73 stop:294 length:222 start_codon:yes stop_codon:yes gene_type:complete